MSDIVRRKESITQDFEKKTLNGFIGIFIHIIVLGFVNLLLMMLMGVGGAISGLAFLITVFTGPLWLVYWNSYIIIAPNEAATVQFFGKYSGTVNQEGFHFFLNPFYHKQKISLRIRNFESARLKVNDVNANPIDIGAVVVLSLIHISEPTRPY